MNDQNNTNNELDSLAEKWVEIVLAHIKAKKMRANERDGEEYE